MNSKPGEYKFQIMQAVAEMLEQPEQQERLYARSNAKMIGLQITGASS